MKNTCNKMRKRGNPYEVWESPLMPGWRWEILKKWQSPDNEEKNEYARWFCDVYSPIVPDGEMGDTYVRDIKVEARAVLVKTNYDM